MGICYSISLERSCGDESIDTIFSDVTSGISELLPVFDFFGGNAFSSCRFLHSTLENTFVVALLRSNAPKHGTVTKPAYIMSYHPGYPNKAFEVWSVAERSGTPQTRTDATTATLQPIVRAPPYMYNAMSNDARLI